MVQLARPAPSSSRVPALLRPTDVVFGGAAPTVQTGSHGLSRSAGAGVERGGSRIGFAMSAGAASGSGSGSGQGQVSAAEPGVVVRDGASSEAGAGALSGSVFPVGQRITTRRSGPAGFKQPLMNVSRDAAAVDEASIWH